MKILMILAFLCGTHVHGLTGNEFLQRCGDKADVFEGHLPEHESDNPYEFGVNSGFCGGYISALTDLMARAESRATADKPAPACFPEGAQVGQAAKIVIFWMKKHPERTHEPAAVLAIVALKEAFPCK